jgi:hypothetical protein
MQSSMIYGDDMKDFSVTTCSLLPSDPIARSTSSFYGRRTRIFFYVRRVLLRATHGVDMLNSRSGGRP